ncbi:MAG: YicC/YloC family endoribonuclease [Kofleriaceae bacterium]|nr:YicC/YloC family endoribonuclease [Kofleriaceae bacterium]
MTGFGRGVVEHAGVRATVDIRAVNHRFLDLKLRGVQLAPLVEESVSAKVRASIERGSVAVSVHVTRHGAAAATTIDPVAAAAAHQTLSTLATSLGLPGPDLALVLAQPGVMVTAERGDEEHPPVLVAVDAALAQLDQMRATEGEALRLELIARFDELTAVRTQIATLAATVPQQLTKRLNERVRKLLDSQEGAEVDPSRLAQEIALLADRSDITEELVRLSSHLDQGRTLIAAKGSVGRRLDFLVQEIGRELNTIGSKSTVTEISTAIVDAKAVLEKVREQVQNVE